jgi:hypothetical protein
MGREEQVEEREVLDSIFPDEIESMLEFFCILSFPSTPHVLAGLRGRGLWTLLYAFVLHSTNTDVGSRHIRR